MKRFISLLIALVSLVSFLTSSFADTATTETVSVLEIHGYMADILLNKSDKKSASDQEKTQYFNVPGQKGSLKSAERYKCQPWAVSITYAETTRQAEILFRSPETQLENANQGFKLIRRGLKANGKRCDIKNASFLFQARLDKEGRKVDFVDYVVKIDGQVMSITHIDNGGTRNYYKVVGDARLPEPKKSNKTTTSTTPAPDTETSEPTEEPTDEPTDEPDPDPTPDPQPDKPIFDESIFDSSDSQPADTATEEPTAAPSSAPAPAPTPNPAGDAPIYDESMFDD
jgi:hypothetical protein